MTDYLFALVDRHFADTIEAVTPREPERRGCQVSLRIRAGRDKGRELFSFLESRGVLGDWREPDVIRIAPVPLYNTHQDVLRLANTLTEWCNG
jgi:kynureninase